MLSIKVVDGAALILKGMQIRTQPKSPEGFGEIFDQLLPASQFVQADGPFFERYDEAFDPGNPHSLVEICLPVRQR